MEIIKHQSRENENENVNLFILRQNNRTFSVLLKQVRNTQFQISNFDYYFSYKKNYRKLSVQRLTKIIGTETLLNIIEMFNGNSFTY